MIDSEMRSQLYQLCHAAHDAAPPEIRVRSRWVMSADWLTDLRSLDDGYGFWFEPPGGPMLLLGLPIETRHRGGAPHLEPWPFNDLIAFVVEHYPEQTRRALDGSDAPVYIGQVTGPS